MDNDKLNELCKSWENCKNPHQDCINCPLRFPDFSRGKNIVTC